MVSSRLNQLGKIAVIVAARTSSTRLPGKVLKPLFDRSLIEFLISRLQSSKHAHEIILATSEKPEDEILLEVGSQAGVKVFAGDLDNVIHRFAAAARTFSVDTVVRVTGDCPFVNGELVDFCLEAAAGVDFDVCSTKGKFPVGLDCEIYTSRSMSRVESAVDLTADHREHLTLYYYHHPEKFKIHEIEPPSIWAGHGTEYTVDEQVDYEFAEKIVAHFNRIDFGLQELVNLKW